MINSIKSKEVLETVIGLVISAIIGLAVWYLMTFVPYKWGEALALIIGVFSFLGSFLFATAGNNVGLIVFALTAGVLGAIECADMLPHMLAPFLICMVGLIIFIEFFITLSKPWYMRLLFMLMHFGFAWLTLQFLDDGYYIGKELVLYYGFRVDEVQSGVWSVFFINMPFLRLLLYIVGEVCYALGMKSN